MKLNFSFVHSSLIFVTISLSTVITIACSRQKNSDDTTLKLQEVLIVGTRLNNKFFFEENRFEIDAIPLDNKGTAILSPNNKFSLSLSIMRNDETSINLPVDVNVKAINVASTVGLKVAVDVDASRFMNTRDPNNLRIQGAKAFFDELGRNRAKGSFLAGLFEYGSINSVGLQVSNLLHDFTDDVTSLKQATDKITSRGYAHTYESLLEVMNLLNNNNLKNDELRTLLFSDGTVSDEHLLNDVCAYAQNHKIKIDSIGFGSASDKSTEKKHFAVERMRGIALCSGGAYYGIASKEDAQKKQVLDENSLMTAYKTMAIGASQGSIAYNVQLKTPAQNIAAGSRIRGILTVTSSDTSASGTFEFTIPNQ